MSAKISSVEKGSIAEELGIIEGSELLSVNGIKLRDYIDYQYAVMTEELTFEIKNPDGSIE